MKWQCHCHIYVFSYGQSQLMCILYHFCIHLYRIIQLPLFIHLFSNSECALPKVINDILINQLIHISKAVYAYEEINYGCQSLILHATIFLMSYGYIHNSELPTPFSASRRRPRPLAIKTVPRKRTLHTVYVVLRLTHHTCYPSNTAVCSDDILYVHESDEDTSTRPEVKCGGTADIVFFLFFPHHLKFWGWKKY